MAHGLFVCLIWTLFQLYRGGHAVLLMENPEKTTELSQVIDTLYHIMLYISPWSRFELTTSAVIGSYYIGNCKSNYHAMTAPVRGYFSQLSTFVDCSIFSFLCRVLYTTFCTFVPFLLDIVFSVFLWFMSSDYTFGIYKAKSF